MPHAALKRPSPSPDARSLTAPAAPWKRLTQVAFFVSLVLVIARVAMQETFRGDTLPVPGTTPEPITPGPATGLLLDLLCCLPALLVLARRLLDSGFVLRLAWSHLATFLLAGWTLASALWSSDKYGALVNASNWAAAIVLLWSTSQLVHSWLRLRLLAGTGFGLLLVLLVQGYYYRFVDLPEFQQEFHRNEVHWLHDRGIAPGSVKATQMEKNIDSGEVVGFSLSRNTYAAVLVFLVFVSAGVVTQRIKDRDHPGWYLPVTGAIAAALLMLYLWVRSKTAFATPAVGAILLTAVSVRGDWFARHTRRLYWGGVALFALAVAAVVGHGLKHGTLFHVSLTFRWQYWVGAARVFVHHPWLGVGWANFRPYYLMYRLPQAAEEPSDPHNFLVRAFVELGILGGLLMLAWMMRLWWELSGAGSREDAGTQRKTAPAPRDGSHYRPIPIIVLLSAVALALNAFLSVDWAQSWPWIFLEVFKRVLFLLVMIGGTALVTIRSWERQELDDRPAPFLLIAMLVALGLFVLHNLIDFSMFEPGPMFLFALLAGGALGMRLPDRPARAGGRAAALAVFIMAGVAWIVAAGAGLAPVAEAEGLAQDADNQIRAARPLDAPASAPLDSARCRKAVSELVEAFHLVPCNADYMFRAEQADLLAGAEPLALGQMLDIAIQTDPTSARYRIARAELEAHTRDLPRAFDDFEEALRLDPNNLELRLEFAQLLRDAGRGAEARLQYEKVLELNGKLAPDEIRRLPEDRVKEIRRSIESNG